MEQSSGIGKAPQETWDGLSPLAQQAFAAELTSAPPGSPVKAVADGLLGRLRHSNPLLAQNLQGAEKDRAAALLRSVAGAVEKPSGPSSPTPFWVSVYAGELLSLALPLLDESQLGEGDEQLAAEAERLLWRAHHNQPLAQLAFERAVDAITVALWERAGEELLAKLRLVSSSTATGSRASWNPRAKRLLLSVDNATLSCARYLGGLQEAERDDYGFDRLQPGRGGRAKRFEQVTVKFEPSRFQEQWGQATSRSPRTPAEEGSYGEGAQVLPGPPSELKAKLLVALLSLAAEEEGGEDTVFLRVRLSDLLAMLGHRLGRSTNSNYYWRYADELVRCLAVDLPNRVAAMQLRFAGEAEARVVFEPLLRYSRPLQESGAPLGAEASAALASVLGGNMVGPSRAVRRAGVHGFEIGLGSELLAALGVGSRLSAIEHLPLGALALRGPAFWLCWQVAFLRRWAKPAAGGSEGRPLLGVLEEAGYLARHGSGGRFRYKDAVRAWWQDVGALAGMGVLDEPGVRIYRHSGLGWREVSDEVSRRLDGGGGRLGREELGNLRVVYTIPLLRIKQLEEARQRAGGRDRPVGRQKAS